MHRPLTILGLAVVALLAPDRGEAARGAEVTTTVYVGRYFEVRDHDQPVKYVFNDESRVARVTGSLSNRDRIQRLRLQPGWNLISLAVTAINLAGQLEQFTTVPVPPLSALYRWRPSTRDFIGVTPEETIEAGAVLWMRAETSALVPVVGTYSEPAPLMLAAGGGYVASAGLERWSPLLPVGVTIWRYDAQAGAWRVAFSGDLESIGDVPPQLAPGDAIFVHTSEALELARAEAAGRTLFYHPDHLESAAAVTDASGGAVEELAYYPFGAVRHRHRARDVEAHYGFTQKEQDRESGLHYFESRYVVSPLGRFPSFDPLLQNLEALEDGELKKLLVEPARLNPFAYALNNPMRYVDPDGRESREARPRPRPRATEPRPRQPAQPRLPARPNQIGPELTIRLGPPTKRPGEIPASSYSIGLRRNPNPTSAGGTGKNENVPNVSEIVVTRVLDDSSTSLFKSCEDGKSFESVLLITPTDEGKEVRLHLKDVIISSFSTSAHHGEQSETLTLNAGSMRFGDPPAPARESREWWDLVPRISQ